MYRVRADLRVREVDGELVVLDRQTDRVHHLNLTAAFVWRKLDGRTPVRRIATALCHRFELDAGQAETDVSRLVEQFSELGLVVRGLGAESDGRLS